MDYSQPDYALQAESSSLQNILSGLRKVFVRDPGLTLQLFLTIALIIAGVALQLSALQWVLVAVTTILFLVAGICRTAALLQIANDPSLSPFEVSRIRCMGNVIVVITAGISFFTYAMIFVPKILELM